MQYGMIGRRSMLFARFIRYGLLLCLAAAALAPAHAQALPEGARADSAHGRAFMLAQAEAQRPAWGARPDAGADAQTQQRPGGWWQTILDMQQAFFRDMGQALRAFKESGTLMASWTLVAVSFLYGIFHAAGPGHGKFVISSYILANGATLRRGVALSFMAAFVQALSAIAIVSVLAVALNAAGIQIRLIAQRFELASGALITLAGLWLLSAYLWRRFRSAQPALVPANAGHGHGHHHHDHDENCGCGHAHMPDPRELEKDWSLGKAATIVLAVGIRPCAGAIFILVFALTQGLYWAGVLATFAMSIGTAITVSALATGAVMFRTLTLRYSGSRWTAGLYDTAAIAGSCLVIFFGVGLFMDSLGPARPF